MRVKNSFVRENEGNSVGIVGDEKLSFLSAVFPLSHVMGELNKSTTLITRADKGV